MARKGLIIWAVTVVVAGVCVGTMASIGASEEELPYGPRRIVDAPTASSTSTSTRSPAGPTPYDGPTEAATTSAPPAYTPPPPVDVPPVTDPGDDGGGERADKRDRYYANCSAAKDAGAAPLVRGRDDGYRGELDRDKDGIACED